MGFFFLIFLEIMGKLTMYGGAYMTGNEMDIRTVKREALPQLSSIAIDESQSPDDRAASFF